MASKNKYLSNSWVVLCNLLVFPPYLVNVRNSKRFVTSYFAHAKLYCNAMYPSLQILNSMLSSERTSEANIIKTWWWFAFLVVIFE